MGSGARGRFGFETVAFRTFIGGGGFFGTESGWPLSFSTTLGPVISRGRNRTTNWDFPGLQFIPEIGINLQILYSDIPGEDVEYRENLNGFVGLRVLKGFGSASLGGSGHVLLGAIDSVRNIDEHRFTVGLRVSADLALANGVAGFELAYSWVTDLIEEHVSSVVLSLYLDWVKVVRGIASAGGPRIGT
jgi:hypothetical protein